MACLDADTIAALANDLGAETLDSDAAAIARKHIDECEACAGRLQHEKASITKQPPPPPRRRQRLDRGATLGRYVVLDVLGAGGMGEVYAAFDPELDRKVAIKILHASDGLTGEDQTARLVREAQAMARLSHPNVIAVHDVGTFDGGVFITMELVQGTTLKSWQREAPRTWREIRAVYLAAARGLAAAHAAGVVHRDFKPDNVLVSKDGAVKVTDFGIARALDAPGRPASTDEELPPHPHAEDGPQTPFAVSLASPGAPASSGSLTSLSSGSFSQPLTEEGTILGTPGYMAREQYLGEPIDARTDQFSFCAALYEGLYGERAFDGKSLTEMINSVVAGKIRPAPEGAKVPAWLRRALLRGLSSDPEKRYPSIDALVEDLAQEPGAKVRRLAATAAALTGVIGAIGFGVWSQRASHAREAQLCSGADAAIGEVWNPVQSARIGHAFDATGVPFATDVWNRTRDHLDAYAARWAEAHKHTCEATRKRGEQSEAVMTLRMTCLEQRREQLRAVTRVLAEADRTTVEKSFEAAQALPAIADCADVATLGSVKPLPSEPAKREAIDALFREVAGVNALVDSGKYKAAVQEALPLVARARPLEHEPLLAEALYALGRAQDRSGAKSEAAGTLRDAVYTAEAARADDLKARALVDLVPILADTSRFDEARDATRFATSAASRLPVPDAYRAELLSARAWTLVREGKHADAVEEFRRAIAIAERAPDPRPVFLARLYSRMAVASTNVGHAAEALELSDRADAILVQNLGKDFPGRVAVHVNKGIVLNQDGKYEQALAAIDQGITIAERAMPPGSVSIANLYGNRAESLDLAGRYAEALEAAHKSYEVGKKAYGAGGLYALGARINEGHALHGLGRYEEAENVFREVLTALEAQLPKDHEWMGEVRLGLGDAMVARRRAREAISVLEQGIAVYDKMPKLNRINRLRRTRGVAALAQALLITSGRSARVDALVEEARAAYAELGEDAKARGLAVLVVSRAP